MVEVSFINPLSSEGRQIVKEYGDLNKLFDEDETLVNEIIHTANQKISDDSLIPKSYKDLAIKRIQWAIEKKNNKNYAQSEFEYLTNSNLYRQDVVTFHILCQAIAIQFNVTSRETRLFIEDNGIGIPASEVPRVFEKSFTGSNGRSLKSSTGMGLFLCDQLCRKLGHSISLCSQENQGTRVTITFARNEFYGVLREE